MSVPKPFQVATVNAALKAFKNREGFRRFLVADEVGLGKTVVAQHVIKGLMKGRRKPFVVFYVCSNLSIARQNQRKLLEILPEEERESATCPVDRLSLMPAALRPKNKHLHLYTLTPETSIPMRGDRRPGEGRQEERALVHTLVKAIWPQFFVKKGADFFQFRAWKWWDYLVKRDQEKARDISLQRTFIRSVRSEFNLKSQQRILPVLLQIKKPVELVARLRNALAASAIQKIHPDLVIFDEFQRFRDLLSDDIDEAAARVIGRLRGEGINNPPALLLLSATPYRLYSQRSEGRIDAAHHTEFFDLVEFLFGSDETAIRKRAECERAFDELEKELRKGTPLSEEAQQARELIQRILRPILSRTERASHPEGWADQGTRELPADLHSADLTIYRHLSESFHRRHRLSAVSYWSSIPLPLQTMGQRYIAWNYAKVANTRGVPLLNLAKRNSFKKFKPWPHPRLRAIQKLVSDLKLTLPWLTPSLPWWRLKGEWHSRDFEPSKILTFCRFRASPQAIAALISFDLETSLFNNQNISYKEVTRRRLLTATGNRHLLLGLFHPSPWLIMATDPLAAVSQPLTIIYSTITGQIKEALKRLNIPVRQKTGVKRRPLWVLLARLEAKVGYWPWVRRAWQAMYARRKGMEDQDAGLGRLLKRWDQEANEPLEDLSPDEVKVLTKYALDAPGIVVGRALCRHWPEAVSREGFPHTLDLVWNGLRTYFDRRWFVSILGGDERSFTIAIRKAILKGNLESVLDEHFWITSKLYSLQGSSLASNLKETLGLGASKFDLHHLDKKDSKKFSLRCHVAMPLIEARLTSFSGGEDLEKPLHADALRRAFNTPFWPNVLATTSVGQEGLDFHVWCRTVVHWDLCNNPVDIEQREGRIQRFGGLSVRQTIANRLGREALENLKNGESPWARLEMLADADKNLSDESGLCPWWVCRGGEIQRAVFKLPNSEEAYRLSCVKERRLLYRLVLGQPNQEDLLELLSMKTGIQPEELRKAMIGLSAWFNK